MAVTEWIPKVTLEELLGDNPLDTTFRVLVAVGGAAAVTTGLSVPTIAVIAAGLTANAIRWWLTPARVPQSSLKVAGPEIRGKEYSSKLRRYSKKKYIFRFEQPKGVITAIACVPVDSKTPAPEAEVIKGGLNYNYVEICLTGVGTGEWSCDLVICHDGV